ILPFVLPQRWAVRCLPRAWRGPQAARASASIIPASVSTPAARQSLSKLASRLARASLFSALAGIAVDAVSLFMALLSSRGISTPSLQAQGGQRRSSYFNIERDIPPSSLEKALCERDAGGAADPTRQHPRHQLLPLSKGGTSMLAHPTHNRLIALGLIGMAKALEEQCKQP